MDTLPALDLRRVKLHPDHWHPVAWSRDLRPGRALGVSFAGEPIVLVRPQDGPIFALEDRCAHRQVPLHAGVVQGCAIRCCYHGWTYDRTGACTDIPYIGRGKLPNGVRAYPCEEKAGLIFIFPGEAHQADCVPLPDLAAASDRAYRTRRLGKDVACHYSFMHENLMDMNHQFLHRRQMGQIRPRLRGLRQGEDWVEVDYTFAREGGKQPLGEAAILGQRRSAGEGNHRDLMTIRTGYPYQTLKIWTADPEPVMDLWITYTPQDREQRSNRTFGLLSIRRPRPAFLLDLFWPALVWFTERIFTEDRWIVEQEQKAHDDQGSDWNQEVFPPIQALRGVLARCGTAVLLLAAAAALSPRAQAAAPLALYDPGSAQVDSKTQAATPACGTLDKPCPTFPPAQASASPWSPPGPWGDVEYGVNGYVAAGVSNHGTGEGIGVGAWLRKDNVELGISLENLNVQSNYRTPVYVVPAHR